jgi:hypothetical protein
MGLRHLLTAASLRWKADDKAGVIGMGALRQQGIASRRLATAGLGMERPVANNGTAAGRQQNRRVEIIIENPPGPGVR